MQQTQSHCGNFDLLTFRFDVKRDATPTAKHPSCTPILPKHSPAMRRSKLTDRAKRALNHD
jgi:hypothetical protein